MRSQRAAPLLFLLTACGGSEPLEGPSVDELLTRLDGVPATELVDAGFRLELARDPEAAVELGLADELEIPDDALTPISDAYQLDNLRLFEGIAERLDAVASSSLSASARLDFDTYRSYLQDQIEDRPFLRSSYPVTPSYNGAQFELEFFFTDLHPVRSEREARAYVARLWRVRAKMDQILDLLHQHQGAGVVLPVPMIDRVAPGIRSIAGSDPRGTIFYRAFADRVALLHLSSAESLLDAAADAIAGSVIPAYRDLLDRMIDQRGHAPPEVGVGTLPDGAAYYAHLLRHYTTTELTADQIHEMGLAMLDAIHVEMNARFQELGLDTDMSLLVLYRHITSDGGSVPADEVGATYEAITKDAELRLADAFDLRAMAPWSVKVGSLGSAYVPAALDGSRPGLFYAAYGDTSAFGMRTLAYHVLVPGHHFQIAIAQEHQTSLFRRVCSPTAYSEGWALYAERLAGELGWYEGDPTGDLGRLQAAAFRAAQLVVDTGLHSKGWSFDQAVQFMVANTGFQQVVAEWEVTRYSVWPGQATAYAIGMSEIVRLREEQRAMLGERFDLTAFHRKLLLAGGVPLPILGRAVR